MSWQTPPPAWGSPPAGPPPDPSFGAPPGAPPGWVPGQRPDRGALIIVLAVSSFMVGALGCAMCGPFAVAALGLSIPAWVMAKRDLAAIGAGQMSPAGRESTQVGMAMAIGSTILFGLVALAMLVLMILYGAAVGMAILDNAAQ